jgi:hypothetical protein
MFASEHQKTLSYAINQSVNLTVIQPMADAQPIVTAVMTAK